LSTRRAKDNATRLLLITFYSDKHLGETPVPLGRGTGEAISALARLNALAPSEFPMAAMLHAHFLACYGPADKHGEISPSLMALQQLPATVPNRAAYIEFAREMLSRLGTAGSGSLCLQQPAVSAA